MEYKLLVLDLDDTILGDDLKISDKNIEAITMAEEKGLHVVLCSGRTMDSMMPYIKAIGIHSDDDYIVSYNGAKINTIGGEEVYCKPIEGSILKDLILIGRRYDIDVQLYTDELLVERFSDRNKLYEKLTGIAAVVINDLTTIQQSTKVLFNHEAGPNLEKLRLELIENYGDIFNIFYSKPFYVEVLDKSVSKGLAIEYLANKMNIDREAIIAVGDGFNDLSMIEYAGLGIAVSNAPDGVKEGADYVTMSSNNESVVWEVVNKYIV